MAPLRRRFLSLAEHHPNVVVLTIAAWAVLVTLAGTYALISVNDQQDKLARVSRVQIVRNCEVSNAARQSLRDLLIFARQRVIQTADELHTPPEQIKNTLEFYAQALARVQIIPCPSE